MAASNIDLLTGSRFREWLDKLDNISAVADKLEEVVTQLRIQNMDPEFWELIPIDMETTTVLPKDTDRYLLEKEERGKLMAASFLVDNPLVYLEIYVDDLAVKGTPYSLYNVGLIGYNPRTFWVSRYDTTNNVYDIWFTPVPMLDYFGKISFRAKAPPLVDVNYTFSIYRYRYKGP
jgi:hypothetical protein